MHIAKGADEDLYPVNVGLLFFNRTPEKFFSRAWIELVVHRDDSGRSFSEHYFKEPLRIQLRDCLAFLKATVIHENVIKVSYQAEAIRFYNFPYEAVVLTAAKNWIKRADLFAEMGLTNHSKNRKAYLDPLLGIGWIQLEHPNNITHPNQRYKITDAGRRYLEFVRGLN